MPLIPLHRRMLWLGLALGCCVAAAVHGRPTLDAGPPKSDGDPARWLPSRTACYVEARNLSQLAKEMADLFSGTPLDNYPFNLRRGPTVVPGWLAELAVWLTPDMLPETQKLGSAAWAVIDTDSRGDMQWVALLHLGDTIAPTTSLRRAMTEGQWRMVEEVAGVKLFYNPRASVPGLVYVDETQQKPTYDCVVAVVQGAILAGSPKALAEVIHRSQGNAVGPSLFEQAAFQQARQAHGGKASAFFHVHWHRLLAVSHPLVQSLSSHVHAKALQQIAGQVHWEKGHVSLRAEVALAEVDRAPLLDAVPPAAVKESLLNRVPGDTVALVAMACPDGERRWERLLESMDSLARLSQVEMRMPSRTIDRLEDIMQVKFAKEFAPHLRQWAVALVHGRSRPLAPLILLEADEPATAEKWQTDWFPRLVSAWVGHPTKLTPMEHRGITFHRADLENGTTWYIGCKDRILLIGTDVDTVIVSLWPGAALRNLASLPVFQKALSETDANGLIVAMRPHPSVWGWWQGGMAHSFNRPPAPPLAGGDAGVANPPPPGGPSVVGQGGGAPVNPPNPPAAGKPGMPGANPGAGMTVVIPDAEMRRRAQQGLPPIDPPSVPPPGGASAPPPAGAAGPGGEGSDAPPPAKPPAPDRGPQEANDWLVVGASRQTNHLIVTLYPFPVKVYNQRLVDMLLDRQLAALFGSPQNQFPLGPNMGMPGGNPAIGQPPAPPPMKGPIFATPVRLGEDPPAPPKVEGKDEKKEDKKEDK